MASELPKPGDIIDRYEVVGEIARGGMAAVFAVRRKSIGGFDKLLALKVLLPNMTHQRQAVERFLDEARIASQISHPNVVEVLDVSEHDGMPYMLMEFLRGQTLAQVARAAKRKNFSLPLGFRLAVLARAAEGLAAAHGTRGPDGAPLGVVHRDVSPQNIHVGYDGEVKVVDFGIAAATGRLADTTTGEFRGKLAYSAPEQLSRKHDIDGRVDVWALGVVAWELLSGKRLFRGDDERQTMFNVLERPIEDIRELAPAVPAPALQAVRRALVRDAPERLADTAAMAHALDAAATEVGGDRRQDIASVMGELFAAERASAETKLAAATRGEWITAPLEPAPNTGQTSGGSLTALSGAAARGSRRRAPLIAAGAAAAALVVAVVGYALLRSRSAAAPPVTPATPSAPVANRTKIQVQVPAELRVALVDGRRHDERPLVLELAPEAAAKIELIAQDGRTLERTVTARDDGLKLELPSAAVAPSASPVAEASAKPAASSASGTKTPIGAAAAGQKKSSGTSGPLLKDPY